MFAVLVCHPAVGYIVYRQLEPELPGDHILCRSHTRAKYVDADVISGDPEAREFVGLIGYLYGVDAECVAMHLSPEETRERRNRRDVTLTLERLKSKAERLLRGIEAGSCRCSEKMRQALAYMLNGWDNLLKYREDGHYTIDNLPAERAIRPFTVYRKNMEHFGNETGMSDAMVYMTVIETLKMWGYNVKEYLERIFADAVKGITDYTQYDPAVMSLVTR